MRKMRPSCNLTVHLVATGNACRSDMRRVTGSRSTKSWTFVRMSRDVVVDIRQMSYRPVRCNTIITVVVVANETRGDGCMYACGSL